MAAHHSHDPRRSFNRPAIAQFLRQTLLYRFARAHGRVIIYTSFSAACVILVLTVFAPRLPPTGHLISPHGTIVRPSAGVSDQVVVVEPRQVQDRDIEGVGVGLRQGLRHPRGVPDTGRQDGHPSRVPVLVRLADLIVALFGVT